MTEQYSSELSKPTVHFTYKNNPDMESLCQGDVLCKTEDLCKVLGEVHPYFLREEYTYFIVLTQSCDLVKRGSKGCKSPYITLAAVREYEDFFERIMIKKKYAESYKGYLLLDEKKRRSAFELIERIYNNTEDDYFFLYKDHSVGLYSPQVAYLKVSIALKSELHYETCLEAKKIELNDEFKAKIGWLVGNMYSRVGTVDWSNLLNDNARKEMIEGDLVSNCVICSKEHIKILKEKFDSVNEQDIKNSVESVLSEIVIKSRYDKAMDSIVDIFNSNCPEIRREDKDRLLAAIKSSRKLEQLIR